ncbi:hypothetical protein Droror1_Dr00004901 [Drosera rotundifolia]
MMNHYILVPIFLILLSAGHVHVNGQDCTPSRELTGTTPPAGQCNTEDYSNCCVAGQQYPTYTCSPPVSSQTRAILTLNSFEQGGDGGGASACDGQYHSDNTPVVALSTGWYNNRSRCGEQIIINGNGQTTTATVVDECDSTEGCDSEHDYQPPCANNTVDASQAVWEALGVPKDQWGQLQITWSDPN